MMVRRWRRRKGDREVTKESTFMTTRQKLSKKFHVIMKSWRVRIPMAAAVVALVGPLLQQMVVMVVVDILLTCHMREEGEVKKGADMAGHHLHHLLHMERRWVQNQLDGDLQVRWHCPEWEWFEKERERERKEREIWEGGKTRTCIAWKLLLLCWFSSSSFCCVPLSLHGHGSMFYVNNSKKLITPYHV
jgi:hypothetical protein